ncbi:MAG: phage terminase large subunit family protein [Patescibacteria group bacterium]|nr:phage terminase large subunit family protein [Patescibacteria group bacterium]
MKRNPMFKGFCMAVRPREKLKPWEWCEKHVVVDKTSSIGGGMKWRLDSSPWVKEFMEVFADNRIETIVIRCATQSSKTQTLILLLCWVISEDPAPALWVANAKDDLKQTVNDRISPTFDKCRPVYEQFLNASVMEYEFSTMSLYFVGGGSKGKVKSKPIRWLFLDEVEEIPPANVYQALERTKAQWNKRRVLLSTANLKTGLMEQFFLKGDQRTLQFQCPHCKQDSLVKWEQFKWDTNDITKSNGKYNFDALAQTIRWECPGCKGIVRDTPYDRRKLARTSSFKKLNPSAPIHTVSFTWPSMVAPWVKWRDVVEKYLNAKTAARMGDLEPLKSFYNDDLGESWDDSLGIIDDYEFLEARKQDYEFGEVWPEEVTRFMSADRQEAGGEHYWWAIRAFGPFWKSRLIAFGRATSTLELEETRIKYNVPIVNAVIDSGFKASEVYKFCMGSRWKAFKGDDAEYFLFRNASLQKTLRRIWERTFVDPYMGTALAKRKSLPLFRFCNNPTKDLLATYMRGLAGEWTIPKLTPREYLKQVTAERREEMVDGRGRVQFVWKRKIRDNHLWDCELQIMVSAVIYQHATGKLGQIPKALPGV